jgi:hypothetical protein
VLPISEQQRAEHGDSIESREPSRIYESTVSRERVEQCSNREFNSRFDTPVFVVELFNRLASSAYGKNVLLNRCSHAEVTIERLERAIYIVADMIVKHDMDLMPTIRQLEAERDKLRQKTTAMDYAREILARGSNQGSNTINPKAA